jgi:hypothetical protein
MFWMKKMRTGREGYLFRDILSPGNARFSSAEHNREGLEGEHNGQPFLYGRH